MKNPKVLGRQEDDPPDFKPDPRAETRLIAEVRDPYEGGAAGTVKTQLFKSECREDRGGLVLRLMIDDLAQSFIPHAFNLSNGIELHIAGEIEAKKTVEALLTTLKAYLSDAEHGGHTVA